MSIHPTRTYQPAATCDTADEAGHADSADVFTALSRELDKGLWFVDAHFHGRN